MNPAPPFAYESPVLNPAGKPYTIDDVELIKPKQRNPRGHTRGATDIVFSWTAAELVRFVTIDEAELKKVRESLRSMKEQRPLGAGLEFVLLNREKGSQGTAQYHRITRKLLFGNAGAIFTVTCEDVHGKMEEFTVDGYSQVRIPPGILTTYRTIKGGALGLLTNTQYFHGELLLPNGGQTFGTLDKYGLPAFRQMQANYKNKFAR